MSTIVNLRGTSGAGKSTVVHTLLKMYPNKAVQFFGAKHNRPLVYEVQIQHDRRPLFIVGPYKTQCGGCDAITGYQNVLPPLLDSYAKLGDILFEGLLISGGYGSVGQALGELEKKGHESIFALLDTPLELCLERVNARRTARGVLDPVNPRNTEQKYKAAHASQVNIDNKYGHRCEMVRHTHPVKDVLNLFSVLINREPHHAKAGD
jgi:hypothetical protein